MGISLGKDRFTSRVLFQTNPPTDPIRPGIFGVADEVLVDIDEAGRCRSECQPKMGHSLIGVKCEEEGWDVREGLRLTFAAAVDTRVGAISTIIYEKGTTIEKFYLWMQCNVLPKLRGTGVRLIVMDNLSAHLNPDLRQLIASEGHILVLRPIHSPDFGGIEWVFHFVSRFLSHHHRQLTDKNIRTALEACFNLVTAEDIKNYFADAHIFVKGKKFKPYLHQQSSSSAF